MPTLQSRRNELVTAVRAGREHLIDMCASLVRVPSENPPGDTRQIAAVAADILRKVPGVSVEEIVAEEPIVNVVARVQGRLPGRRLVFNGHLDTYPIGELSNWTMDPFGAVQRDGRMYGRGAADMKGGIASSMLALELLASHSDAWHGEIVMTLAGDEESMGQNGTAFLLDTVPHARGDVMICGDVGSPHVLRFGEKGFVWLELEARGKASHGAHVHKGVNAIERLIEAIQQVRELRDYPVLTPPHVADAIRDARAVSERFSGDGESAILGAITVNCGVVHGGTSANLVPEKAEARFDIRLPAGVAAAEIESAIDAKLGRMDGVSYRVMRRVDPSWTTPEHEIFHHLQQSGLEILGSKPVVNMRIGASDARLYRQRGLAAVVCGLTPHNLGGPDEYIELEDLHAVGYMHTLSAFDFLSK